MALFMNLSWLLPSGKGIPVLMYHKVWPGINDDLTITPEKLREQWEWLKNEGYSTLSLTDYLDIVSGRKQYAGKQLLITFDDGYRNNLTYAYPLLKELGWQATFFIIAGTLDGAIPALPDGPDQKMSPAELRTLDPANVQLALHGYKHENMGNINLTASADALQRSMQAFEHIGLPWHKVLAYPYGARPGKDLPRLKQLMTGMGVTAAFRIGNKVSEVPSADMYELKRIDIRGTDSLTDFKIKLKKGKLKPF